MLLSDRDSIRIERTCKFRWIPPVGNARNLRGGERNHPVLAIFAKNDIEVVEVSPSCPKNKYLFACITPPVVNNSGPFTAVEIIFFGSGPTVPVADDFLGVVAIYCGAPPIAPLLTMPSPRCQIDICQRSTMREKGNWNIFGVPRTTLPRITTVLRSFEMTRCKPRINGTIHYIQPDFTAIASAFSLYYGKASPPSPLRHVFHSYTRLTLTETT
jgi:hypothetical protein